MHGALSAADLLCGLACILTLCPRQPLEIMTLQACLWQLLVNGQADIPLMNITAAMFLEEAAVQAER